MDYLKKKVYAFSKETIDIINDLLSDANIRQKQLVQYINVPAAFDIETSTITNSAGDPESFMYIWQFGINIGDTNHIIYGRSWLDFKTLLAHIVERQALGKGKRFIIFIHNESYEFAFMAKQFIWSKVFSVERRRPLFARTENGIEFRCSYLLTNLSLNNVAKSLNRYKCSKKVGYLDYKKIRGKNTPLTDKELEYCVDDIHVLLSAIKERIEDAGGTITKIPYTNTGYVRNYCRQACYGKDHRKVQYRLYREYISGLRMDLNFYQQCKRAFAGGYTHANAHYVDNIMKQVGSMDICSSYPASMCLPVYPISNFEKYEGDITDIKEIFKKYCCIFDIEFVNIKPSIEYENYISASKCWYKEKAIENNGRLVSADRIITTITEIDFEIIERCYTWDKIIIKNLMISERGYLPKAFILSILELYKNKTELKGIPEKADFYQNQKGMLNSCFGMTVQDAIQELILYDPESGWGIEEKDPEAELEKYNNSRQRFTYYPWGIYVTAQSRKALWLGIFHLQNDYIYTDTDSLKYRHPQKHQKWFDEYNTGITERLKRMCEHYDIDLGYIEPYDIKGEKHPLGIYESDCANGVYRLFKTLGAKRYIYMDGTGHNASTVSGVKKSAIEYLNKRYGRYGIFEHFNNGLVIPAAVSGKTESVYNDNVISGEAIDYLGNLFTYHELSSVSIRQCDYSMNRSDKFIEYLLGIRRGKRSQYIGG